MAITPQKIQDLADPIEEIYIQMVEELLANIGRHITAPTWTHTAAWETAKLSEMGQLTKESAEIINKWIKSMPQQIRETMEETRAAALDKLEKQMEKAAEEGFVSPPLSDSVVNVLRDYADQAADHLNLVNTTMLQSTLDQYARALQLTEDEVRRAEATQRILNQAAGDVATGVETRNNAKRHAIYQIAQEGLTGFIDRAGHHWTPEAYVNMDIRTTVHNVAIQSTKAFMQDYNTQVFQVSSHAAARPLCYPYQGKFYSWDNSSGEVELGNGKTVQYEPLNATSYGQPAGLFGINCGHYPIPIIPGVTIPHGADNIQDQEANDKAYKESQEQRAIERKIREAKRVVEMSGDLATDKDKERVKKYQQEMREFIDRTGRTRRYDREQIGGTPRPTTPPDDRLRWNKPPQEPTPPPSGFTAAKNITEAEEYAMRYTDMTRFGAVGVSYDGIDVAVANRVNKTIGEFYDEYAVDKFGGILAPKGNSKLGKLINNATAAYMPIRHSFLLNRKTMKTEKTAAEQLKIEREAVQSFLKNPDRNDLSKMRSITRKVLLASKESGRGTVPETIEEVLYHELGHSLERYLKNHESINQIKENMPAYAEKISGYATADISEYIAESFASYKKGENIIDPILRAAFESLKR